MDVLVKYENIGAKNKEIFEPRIKLYILAQKLEKNSCKKSKT